MTHNTGPLDAAARRDDGLAALAAAEAYARGDDEALTACAPATDAETIAQRNLLVMVVGDVIEAGGQQIVDPIRAALIEGPRDGLAAVAAAEAYARGDDEALTACAPATADEALAQRDLLVMALGNVIEAGGQPFVNAIRAALIEGPEGLTPEQLAVVERIDDTGTRQALADIWTTENNTLRGEDDNR